MPTISPILELQRQQLLLQMEYEEEKKAFAQKVDAIGMERRIQRGDAWWPIRIGRTFYNSLNQLCVEVFRTQNDDETDHNFEFGRPIEFFFSEKHKVQSVEFATAPQESFEEKSVAAANSKLEDEFDLSDITHKEKSREDIIAEAEAAAFAEG